MFYTADSLRQMHQGGETVDFLFFYGHQLPSDGSATESCLSQWYPCIFEADGILYQSMVHDGSEGRVFWGLPHSRQNPERLHSRGIAKPWDAWYQAFRRRAGARSVNRSYCAEIFKNFCRIPL